MHIACLLELAGARVEGGRNMATYRLVEELKRRGHDVTIHSFRDGSFRFFPRFLRETPIIREALSMPLWGRRILRQLDGTCDAIILTSNTTSAFYRPSTTALLYCHGVLAEKLQKSEPVSDMKWRIILALMLPFRWLLRLLEKRGMNNVSMVIAVSDNTLDDIIQGLRLNKTPCRVIPNGVDSKAFRPAAKTGDKVLFVGRATPAKGFDTLLQAAEGIDGDILAVVNKSFSNLRQEAHRKGIEFHSNIPHEKMPEIYHQAGAFVLPSLDEEQPLTVLEAMSCGLPVVVTSVASLGLVEQDVNGFIVPPKDAHSLAQAVNRILAHPELGKKMGDANRKIAERYDWSRTADNVEESLRQLISDSTTQGLV